MDGRVWCGVYCTMNVLVTLKRVLDFHKESMCE